MYTRRVSRTLAFATRSRIHDFHRRRYDYEEKHSPKRRQRHAFRTEFQYDATQRRDISVTPLQWRAPRVPPVIIVNSGDKKIAGSGASRKPNIVAAQSYKRGRAGACMLY